MSIRPQDVSERGRRSTLQKQPRSRDVSVTAALLAEKENKVYLPDLPLIVCTWGLSVEKIPESEMNSPRSGWRDADMPFSVFFCQVRLRFFQSGGWAGTEPCREQQELETVNNYTRLPLKSIAGECRPKRH